jgi:uncharacterized protein YdhG (YjbR/CyaY superfamily)
MKKSRGGIRSVDEYIAAAPDAVRGALASLRATIRAAAPGAVEKISYQMPAFSLEGNLVYFAAFKGHIGFYPTSSGIAAFKSELSAYETSKGAVRFPLDEPLPLGLIARIVKFRAAENAKKAKSRSALKRQRR